MAKIDRFSILINQRRTLLKTQITLCSLFSLQQTPQLTTATTVLPKVLPIVILALACLLVAQYGS